MASSAKPTAMETTISKALSAAVIASGKSRGEIATAAKMTLRSLQRYMKGERHPTLEQRDSIMMACGVAPATSVLSAEMGHAYIIGSPWQLYVDQLIPRLYNYIQKFQDEGMMPVDPRSAERDVRMMYAVWEETHRRRRCFLDELAQYMM